MREITIFSGSAHPELAAAICQHLEVPLAPSRLVRFTNDCLEVQLQANCRERDVFIVQPLVPPVQEHLVELLLMLDAARGASAARITVVMPHYAYARSDKKGAPRISIAGRLVADLLATAGAGRVLTMTLHSPQVHGFFSVPVDHLHALTELAEHFRGPDHRADLRNSVVVSPDLGNAKEAAKFARRLGLPVAAAAKERISDDKVVVTSIIGEVRGRDVIVLVASIRVACTHGLFTDGALDRIGARDDVAEIVCTNTVPIPDAHRHPKLTVLSVARPLAEAVRRIHNGESVSVLFEGH
jgi:ribose-phosphate pyrophosphokinase